MTTQITVENFTAAMHAAVAERGADWVYPLDKPEWTIGPYNACRYSLTDGSPACLIGLALHKINPVLVPHRFSSVDARRVLMDHDAPYAVALAARRAQVEQDNGKTWAEALETFDRVLAEQS